MYVWGRNASIWMPDAGGPYIIFGCIRRHCEPPLKIKLGAHNYNIIRVGMLPCVTK